MYDEYENDSPDHNANNGSCMTELKLFNSVQSEELEQQHAATLNARRQEAELMKSQVEAAI